MNDFRWSFSQWETYNSCPAKWKFKSVLKLPGLPPGPAAARGKLIHGTVEGYIKGADATVLHEAIKPKYIPVFDEFRGNPTTLCEDDTKRTLTSIVPGTAVITIFDVSREAGSALVVGEWKSGKPKDTHPDQRSLYALSALTLPGIESAKVTTYYLEDTAPPAETVMSKETAESDRVVWVKRVEQMQTDEYCAPKPALHCNWCDYSKKKGGPCVFGS